MNSQNKIIYLDSFYFIHPATILLCGPTRSGKTTLLTKILHYSDKGLVRPPTHRIVYCYSTWQKAFEEIQMSRASPAHLNLSSNAATIEFRQGLPDLTDFDPKRNNILILDDLMTEAGKDANCLKIFTVDSHHLNITVFFLTQNIFPQEKYSRTISLNSQYMILTNNPRDRNQLVQLGKQIFPGYTKFFAEAFNDVVTQKRFGYLLFALDQKTDEENRVQTGILPDEERIIYRKK
jgi:hypothetical protein